MAGRLIERCLTAVHRRAGNLAFAALALVPLVVAVGVATDRNRAAGRGVEARGGVQARAPSPAPEFRPTI